IEETMRNREVFAMTLHTPSSFLTRNRHIPFGLIGIVFLLVAMLSSAFGALTSAQGSDTDGAVVIIPIQGTIEPGLGEFLDRAITDAEESGATTIILDINTPGGRLDTVLEMRDRILDS